MEWMIGALVIGISYAAYRTGRAMEKTIADLHRMEMDREADVLKKRNIQLHWQVADLQAKLNMARAALKEAYKDSMQVVGLEDDQMG